MKQLEEQIAFAPEHFDFPIKSPFHLIILSILHVKIFRMNTILYMASSY